MTNREVVKAWKNYDSGNAGHLHTNGNLLYSYGLEIGYKGNAGELFVIDYTSRSGRMYSQTTSHHVYLACGVADYIVNPVTNQVRTADGAPVATVKIDTIPQLVEALADCLKSGSHAIIKWC